MSGSEIAVVAMVGFGSALLGALAGGVTTALLEIWKQVLTGLAAARVIRYEVHELMTNVQWATSRNGEDVILHDGAWQAHRLALAPLLSEQQMHRICGAYAEVFVAQDRLRSLGHVVAGPPDPDESARTQLESWTSRLSQVHKELRDVERTRRSHHFLRLLRRRPSAEMDESAAMLKADRPTEH